MIEVALVTVSTLDHPADHEREPWIMSIEGKGASGEIETGSASEPRAPLLNFEAINPALAAHDREAYSLRQINDLPLLVMQSDFHT